MEYQETSRAAWQEFVPVSAELDYQICQELDKAGPQGLSDADIEERIQRSHQSVSANRRHLVERGVVKATKLRGKTKSGRAAILWVLSQYFNPEMHDADWKPPQAGPLLQKSFF